MLQAIRSRAGGIVVKVLFVLLILSFGFWGLYTRSPFFQNEKSPDAVVATVGDRDIRADELQAALQPTLERLRAQFGGTLEPAQIKQLGILDAVLDQQIQRSLLDQEVARLRLDLSDDVVSATIKSNPAFVGPDGKFSYDRFNQLLALSHMTEAGFEARLRQELPRGDMLQALTAGVRIPAQVIDAIYRQRAETRVADVVAVPLAAAGTIGAPSDDDISKFYDAHQDMFKASEYRGFTLASLSAEDVAGDVKITDEQLKAAYDEHKEDLAIPEQRQIEQILAPTEEKAKAAAAALAAGQDFKQVATTIAGQDPQTIDLGLVKASDLPKPIADAAFDLPLDKPSEPVKDSFGWHILLVTKIEPGKTPSFDEAKKQLTEELTQEAEVVQLETVGHQVEDALGGGATIADVAAKYHLKTVAIAAADASGRDPAGKPIELSLPAQFVLKAVFDTGENETSRVNALEEGVIFVVHVDKVVPSRAKPLADVKDQVVVAWTAEQKQQAVKTEAEALAAAIAGGTPIAKAASDKGLTVTTTQPLGRRPAQGSAIPPSLVAKLFGAKVGEAVVVSDANGAFVAQLTAINLPDSTPAGAASGLQTELGNAARYDLVSELTEALKKRFPVTIHRDVLEKQF